MFSTITDSTSFQYYIGSLKKNAEDRFDDYVRLFIEKMTARAEAKDVVCLSDRVA